MRVWRKNQHCIINWGDKKFSWKKPEEDIYASKEDKSFAYFVRSTATTDEVEKVFGKVEYTNSINEGELAFVTQKLNSTQMEQNVAVLAKVISAYRILDWWRSE